MMSRVVYATERDGRWIADCVDMPGVMAYGSTRYEAQYNVGKLAIEVIAERMPFKTYTLEGEDLERFCRNAVHADEIRWGVF